MMQTTEKLYAMRLLFIIFLAHNSSQMILAGKTNQQSSDIVERIKKYPRRRIATKRYNPNARKQVISLQEEFFKQTIAQGVKKRTERIPAAYYIPVTDKEARRIRARKFVLRNQHYNKKRAALKKYFSINS